MSSFLQMGHNSYCLLRDENLQGFNGAVLSPANEDEESLIKIRDVEIPNFKFIFDPQLYLPKSKYPKLKYWKYFPKKITPDLGCFNNINESLGELHNLYNFGRICSPTILDENYTNNYYEFNNLIAEDLQKVVGEKLVYLTVIIRVSDLLEKDRRNEIASIISSSNLNRIYLLLDSNNNPRKGTHKINILEACINFIKSLKESKFYILMGYSSSDLVLWRYFGVDSFATGNHLNRLRFASSDFNIEQGGGRRAAYWFEESLMAFIRGSDLLRLKNENLLSYASSSNPYYHKILEHIEKHIPWISLGERQYLYWFIDFEERLRSNKLDINKHLDDVKENWSYLRKNRIYLDDKHNDGSWITNWKDAILHACN